MNGELPAGRPAHRKPAHDQPVRVDGKLFPHLGQRFQQIDFAGELVRVAVSAVQVEDERIPWRELAGGLRPFPYKR